MGTTHSNEINVENNILNDIANTSITKLLVNLSTESKSTVNQDIEFETSPCFVMDCEGDVSLQVNQQQEVVALSQVTSQMLQNKKTDFVNDVTNSLTEIVKQQNGSNFFETGDSENKYNAVNTIVNHISNSFCNILMTTIKSSCSVSANQNGKITFNGYMSGDDCTAGSNAIQSIVTKQIIESMIKSIENNSAVTEACNILELDISQENKGIIDTIIDGITSIVNSLVDGITSIFGSIIGIITKLFDNFKYIIIAGVVAIGIIFVLPMLGMGGGGNKGENDENVEYEYITENSED